MITINAQDALLPHCAVLQVSPKLVVEVQEKFRFTAGVFDDYERLRRALDDLAAGGWSVSQLCLTGLPPTVNAIPTSGRDLDRTKLTSLLAQFEECQRTDAPLASSSTVLEGISPRLHFDGSLHLPSHLSERLSRHIEAGAIVLFVSSTSASQQDQSTRILLRHATLDILGHEFLPSPSSDIDRTTSAEVHFLSA